MQDEVKYEYYDIAVANILADVIIMLQKEIPVHIKKNGIFITSVSYTHLTLPTIA